MKKKKEKCYCKPQGLCLRCAKMMLKAHSEGYDHAIKDTVKFLSGKKPTDRFTDVNKKLTS